MGVGVEIGVSVGEGDGEGLVVASAVYKTTTSAEPDATETGPAAAGKFSGDGPFSGPSNIAT